jgi:aminoglycoside phosphotransferase (APT) family kinase protein
VQPAARPNSPQYLPRSPIRDEKSGWKVASTPPPLSVEAVESLLSQWRGSRPVARVDTLDGGLMNRNYKFRFADSREAFVLRLFDRDASACAKEAAVLRLVGGDVPVPRALHVERNGAGGFPPFLVLEFIDGISLRELKRRGDLRSIGEAAYDAGRALAGLARHRFDRSGLLTPTLTVEPGMYENATTSALIDHFAESPAFQRRIDTTLTRRVKTWARSREEQASGPPSISLAHGDFNAANILVREQHDRWTVAAILDWEFAFAGSPLCDVGNMLRYERADRPRFEPHFSRGCIDGGLQLSDDWLEQARLADLPALCELLSRDAIPDAVVDELRDLITDTSR